MAINPFLRQYIKNNIVANSIELEGEDPCAAIEKLILEAILAYHEYVTEIKDKPIE